MDPLTIRQIYVRVNALDADRADLRAFAMAAALLGIPLKEENDFVETRRIVNGKEVRHVSWFLKQKDSTGQHKTNELWKRWNDPEWLSANPEHLLSKFKEYWQALKDAVVHEKKSTPIVVLGKGKRHIFVPQNLPENRKSQLLEMLE